MKAVVLFNFFPVMSTAVRNVYLKFHLLNSLL